MSTNKLFEAIKPICIKILDSGEINDIIILHSLLKKIKLSDETNSKPFNFLVQYTAFPLIIKLKNLQKGKRILNDELEEILECLGLLLENSSEVDWLFFRDVFFQVFLLMSVNPEVQKVNTLSEECQSKALQVIIHLCNGIMSKDIKNYLSLEFKAQLGHAIFVCLHIAETEKKISLRLLALHTMTTLGLYIHQSLSDEIKLFVTIFASFLPGIAMKLGKIANAGETQNHKVTVAAIDTWKYFIVYLTNDETLKLFIPKFDIVEPHVLLRNGPLNSGYTCEKDSHKQHSKEQMPQNSHSILIDKEWLSTTKGNLLLIVKTFSSLVSHPHWQVRHAIGSLSFSVASRCVKSLDNIVVILLENLIILSNDSLPDVSTEARQQITSLEKGFCDEIKADINNDVMERILLLIRKIHTIARFQDDDHILNIVNQLSASFTIKSYFSDTTLDSVYLDKIVLSFATLLTLDSSEPELLHEHLAINDNIQILSLKPGIIRTFKYFQNEKIYNCICNICHVICQSFSLMALTDSCIDLIQGNSLCRTEGFLLLMLFLEGATKIENCNYKQIEVSVMSILDTVIDLQIFNVSVSPFREKSPNSDSLLAVDNKNSSISLENARSNVILLSYALQVVGKCSLLLKKEFSAFLNVILYYLLEKAGETNNVVSNSAILALEEISESNGHESLSKFIESSVPYFWYNLSLRLKKIPQYPSAPQVLRFTLVSHKIEMKTYIEELVEDILDSLDVYHIDMAIPLMTVLLTYTESLNITSDKLFCIEMNEFLVTKVKKQNNVDDVVNSLLEYVKNQKIVDDGLEDRNFIKEPLSENDFKLSEPVTEETDNEIEIIPKHITICQSILERISYLLSLRDRRMQLICLQVIQSSFNVLYKWENQKLPIFHKLWKPLVFCIKGKDFVVMLKAAEVSILMLVSSGDFLLSRYFKELLPHFMDLLSSQCSTSLGKTRKSGFYLSPGYKLQLFLLEKLPILVKSLELGVKQCKKVVEILLRYVEKKQPYEFVKLALICLEYLIEHNKYLMWYLLTKTRGISVMAPDSDKYNTITVHGSKKEDFHDEMTTIFKTLHIK